MRHSVAGANRHLQWECVGMATGTAPRATRPITFADVEPAGLRGWARLFAARVSPRIIVVALTIALVARIAVGGWRRADLAVAAVLVAAQPFTEWLIHVVVLHFRPRRRGGRTIDLYIARKHRAHHVDPADIGLVFVATPALVGLIAGDAVVMLAVFRDVHLWLTALVTGYGLLLGYEWTHYLIHTPHIPRSWWYRRVWRAHRLHHFKNEHHWFGITSHLADRVLRTFPDRSAVPTSPTARNLHGEATLGVG